MGNACAYVRQGVAVFFEYDTPKIVHIRSKSIGIINRLVQLAIIAYLIVWVFILKKGYQLEDTGISASTTKVKGVTYTNSSDPRIGRRVWDSIDLVVPAEENNAFFVTTNVITTPNQKQGVCAEDPSVKEARCYNDTDCQPVGKPYLLGHGVTNGTCSHQASISTCFIHAWCPLENDTSPVDYAVLNGTKHFTVLIKNHVYFPYYGKTRSNIIETTNKTYLQGCKYDDITNPFCPVFELDYMVFKASENAVKKGGKRQTYDEIAVAGGVISIRVKWDCNFDYSPLECKPQYDFDQLDKGEDSLIAKGYNFRYADNYFINETQMRQQIKAFGILFIMTVDAKAAAFNVIPTLTNLGSGLALLGVATVLCDIFVLYVHKRKKFFQEHKYEQVKTADAYEVLQ